MSVPHAAASGLDDSRRQPSRGRGPSAQTPVVSLAQAARRRPFPTSAAASDIALIPDAVRAGQPAGDPDPTSPAGRAGGAVSGGSQSAKGGEWLPLARITAWRHQAIAEVEAGLLGVWNRACGSVGLVDDDAPGHAVIPGIALACVGSLARREAGPASDLDLILLTDPHAPALDAGRVAALAEHLWYPLWDAGISLDHSVRSLEQCRQVASRDLPAAVGLLDVRHLAGDANLTSRVSRAILHDWRAATRKRLPELAHDAAQRAQRCGDIAGLLEPDLKEAHGGLRDAVLVHALAASSLADRPHGAFDQAVLTLLAVRDALALATGRPSNKLVAPVSGDVAAQFSLSRDELLMGIYGASRIVADGLETTMRSALRAARPARRPLTIVRFGRRSAPVLEKPDEGVAIVGDEVVMADGAAAALADPALALRLACVAAARNLPISVVTRQSLARAAVPDGTWAATPARTRQIDADLSDPRGRRGDGYSRRPHESVGDESAQESMLDLLLTLLGSGAALMPVWDHLDLAGLPSRWIPGWGEIRNRPQHNPIHLYTVDRHMVRATAVAAVLTRQPGQSARLDQEDLEECGTILQCCGLREQASVTVSDRAILLLATLIHDLGKVEGAGRDHAGVGAELVAPVAAVWGIDATVQEEIRRLVAHHLLLGEVAAAAPGDEQAAARVRDALGSGREGRRRLALLRLLTEADSRAAGPRAWTSGRGAVIDRATAAMAAVL